MVKYFFKLKPESMTTRAFGLLRPWLHVKLVCKMDIHVTPEASRYILQKGGHVTIYVMSIQGWWSGTKLPAVCLGQPKDLVSGRFHKIEQSTLTIWIQENIQSEPGKTISIHLKSRLWFKQLQITGATLGVFSDW